MKSENLNLGQYYFLTIGGKERPKPYRYQGTDMGGKYFFVAAHGCISVHPNRLGDANPRPDPGNINMAGLD